MVDLKLIPVRATVVVGGLSVSTPYVVSFNVNRSRGQISTFSATIKVHYAQLASAVGGPVTITAGPALAQHRIFTGICRSSNVTPCRDDPAYILLTVSGEDILSELKNKKITRRCKSSKATWVEITGVVRPGIKSGKLAYQDRDENLTTDGMNTQNENTVTYTHGQNTKPDGINDPPREGQEDIPILEVVNIEPPPDTQVTGGQ